MPWESSKLRFVIFMIVATELRQLQGLVFSPHTSAVSPGFHCASTMNFPRAKCNFLPSGRHAGTDRRLWAVMDVLGYSMKILRSVVATSEAWNRLVGPQSTWSKSFKTLPPPALQRFQSDLGRARHELRDSRCLLCRPRGRPAREATVVTHGAPPPSHPCGVRLRNPPCLMDVFRSGVTGTVSHYLLRPTYHLCSEYVPNTAELSQPYTSREQGWLVFGELATVRLCQR
ncbi:hypothetical protein Bbelb_237810 [Branchiostoma belcheri]|nr:hypothetical protein Bbelb_237810 [Branchiostoma belcheri]